MGLPAQAWSRAAPAWSRAARAPSQVAPAASGARAKGGPLPPRAHANVVAPRCPTTAGIRRTHRRRGARTVARVPAAARTRPSRTDDCHRPRRPIRLRTARRWPPGSRATGRRSAADPVRRLPVRPVRAQGLPDRPVRAHRLPVRPRPRRTPRPQRLRPPERRQRASARLVHARSRGGPRTPDRRGGHPRRLHRIRDMSATRSTPDPPAVMNGISLARPSPDGRADAGCRWYRRPARFVGPDGRGADHAAWLVARPGSAQTVVRRLPATRRLGRPERGVTTNRGIGRDRHAHGSCERPSIPGSA